MSDDQVTVMRVSLLRDLG